MEKNANNEYEDAKNQYNILLSMINVLPYGIAIQLSNQVNITINTIMKKQSEAMKIILNKLEDLKLDVSYLEFDRQATQKERDKL